MASNLCSSGDCAAKKYIQKGKDGTKDEPFIPLRLLVCGHSVCDLCVLQYCQRQTNFIKCSICAFNTTISESVQRSVLQSEPDIKRWVDPTSVMAPEVLRFDTTLFPLDYHQIGCGVFSGVLSATKTAEMIDLDDLEEETPSPHSSAITPSVVNSLFEDDAIVKNVISRIAKTAPKNFQESVESGVKTFTDLSQNHSSIKRVSDETKDWFKKIKTTASGMFHRLHSVLQIRERELMEEIDAIEVNRQLEIKVVMNEILSKRSELKGKLLQSSQLQTDKDRTALKKAIDRLLKDAAITPMDSPQNEFKFRFEASIENHLKKYGKVERMTSSLPQESVEMEEIPEVVNNKSSETPIEVSSDEEDVDVIDVAENHNIDKEVVTILRAESPSKFYVQKSADRERFDILNEEINSHCCSAYYHSPGWDTLKQGESVFAYSLVKRCWCRASLTLFRTEANPQTRETNFLADIVLIDYGISETVHWYNIREKKMELFDPRKWPPFAYKCSLYGIKPNRKSGNNWNQSAIDLFNQYIKDNQLILIDFETKDGTKYVDLIHYDVPNVTYQIPSVIEMLVKIDIASVTTNISFEAYSKYKNPPLKYKMPETPRIMKTTSVLVSHVESPDLFYVQLQRYNQKLLQLITDLNAIYTENNVGIYTYYCPKVNTPCAAIYEGDNQYYRALVIQKGKTPTEWVVQFVDFGNKQTVNYTEMRLLRDEFMEMPIQSIPCGLIHVDPMIGFKWTKDATDQFKHAVSNDRGPQILTMFVYEMKNFNQNQQKLLVVLRSFDGDKNVKVNEHLVKMGKAVSTGPHSKSDPRGDLTLSTSMESLNSMASSSSAATNRSQVIPMRVSALEIMRGMIERNTISGVDKKGSLIKVKVSYIVNPSEFYLQIDTQNVNKLFDDMETKLHDKYSSTLNMFTGDLNFREKEFCAFKLKNLWRRGLVLKRIEQLPDSAPEEPKYYVCDLDHGGQYDVRVSTMRQLSDDLTFNGPLAAKCKLHCLRPAGGDQWTHSAVDEFKVFVDNYSKDLSILVKGPVDFEPISVILYSNETSIAGPFAKAKTVYKSAQSFLIDKAVALYERTGDGINEIIADDEDMNSETPHKRRGQMPFSLSNGEGILENLENRFGPDPEMTPMLGTTFQYLEEQYPETQSFCGMPTDLKVHPKDFHIAFRLFNEGSVSQPIDIINDRITKYLQQKGELPQLQEGYKKGDACSCYFDFDKTWNRAEIVGLSKDLTDLKVVVRFVDYDNQEHVMPEKLSQEVFGKEIPRLALNCQLTNIKPISEDARHEIRTLIYTEVLDKKCRFYWENYPNKPMKVTIDIPDPTAPKNSFGQTNYIPFIDFLENKQLLAYGRVEDNEKVEQILDLNPIVDQIYGLYPIIFQIDRFYEVVMSYFIGPDYAFFQALDLRYPVGNDKVINEQHDRFLQMLDVLGSEIDNYPRLNDIEEGKHCVAKYVDDSWYRGLIADVDDLAATAQVFFVDYGNNDPIRFSDIRQIPSKHLKPNAHSFLCQIHNIKPANTDSWSRNPLLVKQINDRITEQSDERKMFARFKNNKYPLKIDLYYYNPDDSTTPDKHLFQDFVDKGLLEFIDSRDVYHKPVETTSTLQSFRTKKNIKSERN